MAVIERSDSENTDSVETLDTQINFRALIGLLLLPAFNLYEITA